MAIMAPTVREILCLALDHLDADIDIVIGAAPTPGMAATGASSGGSALSTSWNQFQHRLRGAGLSSAQMAGLYHEEQAGFSIGPAFQPTGGRGSGAAPNSAGRVLEMGYLLVRAPDELAHLRGHHRCAWAQFLQRLGLTQQEWTSRRAQFFTPKYTTHDVMESIWRDQRLQLPVPVDPGAQHSAVGTHAEHNRRNMANLRTLGPDAFEYLSEDFHPSQRPLEQPPVPLNC